MKRARIAVLGSIGVAMTIAACGDTGESVLATQPASGMARGTFRTTIWTAGENGLQLVRVVSGDYVRDARGNARVENEQESMPGAALTATMKADMDARMLTRRLRSSGLSRASISGGEVPRVRATLKDAVTHTRMVNGKRVELQVPRGAAPGAEAPTIITVDGQQMLRDAQYRTVAGRSELQRSTSTTFDATGNVATVVQSEFGVSTTVGSLDRFRSAVDAVAGFLAPAQLYAATLDPTEETEEQMMARCFDEWMTFLGASAVHTGLVFGMMNAIAACAPSAGVGCVAAGLLAPDLIAADLALGYAIAKLQQCRNKKIRPDTLIVGGGEGGDHSPYGSQNGCDPVEWYISWDNGITWQFLQETPRPGCYMQ
jgi:hypothetical protein